MGQELYPPRVMVLGGGLAGIAAACALLERGLSVTLLEKRPFLGGRAYSFIDPRTGFEVDNGQHVFMGCCTEYVKLLEKLGTLERAALQERLVVEVRHKRGGRGLLASHPRLGPFHLLPTLLKYPYLSLPERLLALYALLRIHGTDRRRHREQLERETFYAWLKRHRQSEGAVQNLWNLIVLPTCNEDVHSVSAYMGFMVFQEGLLKGWRHATLGLPRVGLSRLIGEAARDYLEARGGKVLLNAKASRLLVREGEVEGVLLASREILRSEFYISALPFDALLELLPEALIRDPFFARFRELSFAPIVNVHLWYDRPVMEQPFVAFLGTEVQWVFNKTLLWQKEEQPGQHLSVSLSGAHGYVEMPKGELLHRVTREMEALFPRSQEARLLHSLVVKEVKATLRPLPGTGFLRPPSETPLRNLVLAGDWTDTDWPSTMEGAVRSGLKAAEVVLAKGTRYLRKLLVQTAKLEGPGSSPL